MVNFDTVRDVGLKLPGVEDFSVCSAGLKVRGQPLACIPTNRSAEPGSLVLRMDFDDRSALLAADPDVYLPHHYVGCSAVLVRLSRVSAGTLRDLLGMAHKFVHPQSRAPGIGAQAPLMGVSG